METTLLDSCYHPGMDVGHHTAYEAAMSTAAGYIDVSETMARLEQETDDLEYSICAYGVAKMLLHREKKEEANILLQSIVRRDSFWICYAYLAAWNDLNKTSEER